MDPYKLLFQGMVTNDEILLIIEIDASLSFNLPL